MRGDRIRSTREARGLTLQTCAETAGMQMSQLSKLERDLKTCEAETLGRLAVTLGVSADFLLGLSADPRPRP